MIHKSIGEILDIFALVLPWYTKHLNQNFSNNATADDTSFIFSMLKSTYTVLFSQIVAQISSLERGKNQGACAKVVEYIKGNAEKKERGNIWRVKRVLKQLFAKIQNEEEVKV